MELKHFFSLAMLIAMPFVNPIPVSGMGGDPEPKPVQLTTTQYDNEPGGTTPSPKSPIIKPQIGIEDYTLYI